MYYPVIAPCAITYASINACIAVSASANSRNLRKVVLRPRPLFYVMECIEVNNAVFQQWRKFYEGFPMTEDVREALLNYVGNLLSHKACVILDAEHLAKLLCIEKASLFAIINKPEAFYRSFEIKKKSGGVREIRAPYPSLKTIQQWIYEYVLKKQYVHGCAHGFRPRKSIVTNVRTHVDNKCLLKLDLKDFFPSIKINRVVQAFKEIGYTKTVSWLLATICCLDEELPQGAPTSPALSNIVARHMDKRLYRLAKSFGYRYSRYADDISFSGDNIPVAFIKYATDIIEDCGFTVNPKKVRLYNEKDNRILTGVALKDGVLRLPREKRREYEQEIYYALKYGVNTRMKGEYKYFSTYILSLRGKANFWLMIEPENKFIKKSIPQLKMLYKNAIGMKNSSNSFISSLLSSIVDIFSEKKNWGLPQDDVTVIYNKSKLITTDIDLAMAEDINVTTADVRKLAEGVINGLNKNLIYDYSDRLEQKPHDVVEIDVTKLRISHFGLAYPAMYTYLFGGVLTDNMLPKQFSKRKASFDDSIIWAIMGGVPEISFAVSRLPKSAEGMKRIGNMNLYYKYEEKKLTIGTFVGYEDLVEQKARKIVVKFG